MESIFQIRKATLDDITDLVRLRRIMFEEMGNTDTELIEFHS